MKDTPLQAKDLRIGNWIASGKEFKDTSIIGKVLEIGNEEREFEQIYCMCEESFEWFFKDNYCGIPLTHELLERCGFKKVEEEALVETYDAPGFDLWIFKSRDGNYYDYHTPDGGKPLIGLHDLQNWYRFRTGSELDVKWE